MTFSIFKKSGNGGDTFPVNYKCFTFDDNELVINKLYNLYVKDLNWKIKRVEERTDDSMVTAKADSLAFFLGAMAFIFVSPIILGIIGIIYYKQYSSYYIITIFIFAIILFISLRIFNQFKSKDATISNDSKSLNKSKILYNNKLNSKNLIIKDLSRYLYLLIVALLCAIYLLVSTNFLFSIDNYFPFLLVLFLIFWVLSYMLHYINIDNHLMQKYELNYISLDDIKNLKKVKILRPIKSVAYEKYFIINSETNALILNVQKNGFMGIKYTIYSQENVIAEIKKTFFPSLDEYIIRPINEKPYSVNFMPKKGYQIIGLEGYAILCDKSEKYKSLLYNGKVVASLIAIEKNNSKWQIMEDANINIVLIILCLTICKRNIGIL
jgi:hypothetical protein